MTTTPVFSTLQLDNLTTEMERNYIILEPNKAPYLAVEPPVLEGVGSLCSVWYNETSSNPFGETIDLCCVINATENDAPLNFYTALPYVEGTELLHCAGEPTYKEVYGTAYLVLKDDNAVMQTLTQKNLDVLDKLILTHTPEGTKITWGIEANHYYERPFHR